MTSVKLSKLTAVILAALLMLALFITPALAESDGATAEADIVAADAADTAEADDEADAADAADADDDAEQDVADDETDDETDDDEDEKSFNWDLWISVGIIVAAVLVFFGFYLFSAKWRAKVQQFIREYKSELKKVVWSPWSDVKKNTVVVLVLSLGTALLIGVLDVIFSKGINALGSLIK